ncbi:MAG: T9SS type A sorting domain-containing protein [Vicingaceae bacterium]
MRQLFLIPFALMTLGSFAQGPYAPAAGISGTTAMHKDSSTFMAWADQCSVVRGFQDIAQPSLGLAAVGDSTSAIGQPNANGVVSLGDGGSATLSFPGVIFDGPGHDFAIFENGFSNINGGDFLELAFVEVSSDGQNFFRFPAHSLTDTSQAVGSFGSVDPTQINNLAGKYLLAYGTPFDLAELNGINGLDVQNITHIRIIDVVGSLNNAHATRDTAGRKVNDPYPTAFPQSGFDLDAVGIVHIKSVGLAEKSRAKKLNVYPNPVENELFISADLIGADWKIHRLSGGLVASGRLEQKQINCSNLNPGLYLLQLIQERQLYQAKLIVK